MTHRVLRHHHRAEALHEVFRLHGEIHQLDGADTFSLEDDAFRPGEVSRVTRRARRVERVVVDRRDVPSRDLQLPVRRRHLLQARGRGAGQADWRAEERPSGIATRCMHERTADG